MLGLIAGVFAGTARGAVIGAVVGACACFVVLMGMTIADAIRGHASEMAAGQVVLVLLLGALWFAMISVSLGAIVGAALGAMVGTFFPVRRNRGGP